MRRFLRIVAASACIAAPLLMLAGGDSAARVIATFLLFGMAPGVAALPWLAPRLTAPEPALIVVPSIAVSIVLAQAMLWTGLWDPRAATVALAVACLVPISLQLRREEVR